MGGISPHIAYKVMIKGFAGKIEIPNVTPGGWPSYRFSEYCICTL